MAVAYVIFGVVMPSVWNLLNWQVPGFSFTAKSFIIALILMNLCVSVCHLAVGVGQRSGHSSRHRTSNERKNDEK